MGGDRTAEANNGRQDQRWYAYFFFPVSRFKPDQGNWSQTLVSIALINVRMPRVRTGCGDRRRTRGTHIRIRIALSGMGCVSCTQLLLQRQTFVGDFAREIAIRCTFLKRRVMMYAN